MKRETYRLLQRLLTYVSFLLACAATGLFLYVTGNNGEVPLWLLGLLGYAWTFVGFLILNGIGKAYARKIRPMRMKKSAPPNDTSRDHKNESGNL